MLSFIAPTTTGVEMWFGWRGFAIERPNGYASNSDRSNPAH